LDIKEASVRKAAFCTVLFVLGIFLAGALPATGAPLYKYKDLHLGTGYFSTYARGINASGQVVGDARTQVGDRAFLYNGRVMQLLPTLPAPYNVGGYARGINASGQVVWYCTNSSGYPRAFVYTPGSGMQDLGLLFESSSTATCINDAGQVAGYYQTSEPISHTRAFLYTPGVGVQTLDTLIGGEDNEARAINNAGQVGGVRHLHHPL
jgi:probable HAF family extracellular repeat protein